MAGRETRRGFSSRGGLFADFGAKVFRGRGEDGGDLGVDLVVAEGARGVAEAESERDGFFSGGERLAAVGADEVCGLEERGVRGVDEAEDVGPGDGFVDDEREVALDGREGGERVGGGFGGVEGGE